MSRPRKRKLWSLLTAIAAVAAAASTAFVLGVVGGGSATAQTAPGRSSMETRLDQLIQVLASTTDRGTAATAIDDGMEILYGGLRAVPSKDALEQTKAEDQMTSAAELHFADALQRYAMGGGAPEERGRALDLKLMIEQMNEVAAAVGEVTAQCGQGDTLGKPPCDQLMPLIDDNGEPAVADPRTVLKPGFEVSLRSPIVPPWFRSWQHDIRMTAPMDRGQCTAVFKETRGLLARLVLDRIIIVTDPWVATFGVPRGTAVPIWTIRWIPVQYVKVWNICNTRSGMETTVSTRIKRDFALTFFWRFYPKDP